MLPVSGQPRASSFGEERLGKYHCVLQAVFAFRSYQLHKKATVIAKMIRFTSWGSSVPASRFLLLGPEGKYLFHGV